VTPFLDDAYYTLIKGDVMHINNYRDNVGHMKKLLTNREKEIFELLIQNRDTDQIAALLNISSKTVRNHISNVIQKLGVKGRSQALLELIKMQAINL